MNAFHTNITNIYGNEGIAWLTTLPTLVDEMSSKFELRDLAPLQNLTHNYVLSGFRGDASIILKLGLDYEELKREAKALKCFAGYGAVKMIAEDNGALLLERAIPGISLKAYFPDRETEAIEISCDVMTKLHKAKIPAHHNFPHIKDWLAALDKDCDIPTRYLHKARELRDKLLQTAESDLLLHGDLHHDNILQNGSEWVVIDPKGVIGDPTYEVAAFIRNPIPVLLEQENVQRLIEQRIEMFASALCAPRSRIADWCFVQGVLGWIWAVEDGGDVEYWEGMLEILDQI